ncbi:IclR family transcriptional regulator [Kaistia dalseonensis]|uniref:DNA-binding IclR family transcriptional regulator n=1 Tax=Kaistia dalseonensis TaxID=410840 RepID=A0ABU0H8C0_9HYPH|nr:IclR family transcriptional regulator [Kaistia dalseonensis]MCX5495959.1 IclR family transcriptional regulator [Kaistia dalseonensis]MDQ0438562.1 DNA-binding IclR family transcriptional regulator [Kaistia dalseonensis]
MLDDNNDRYRAPALDKGLDILELLAATDQSMTQAEIAKALNRSPNEIYRMLDRLVRRGYVARVLGDRYELTLRLFALAHQHAPVRRLVSQALPVMRNFSKDAEQACHLAVYDRGRVVVVAQMDAPSYWSYSIRVGAHVGLYNTGSGHVLLAFATPALRAMMEAEREREGRMDDEARPDGLDERLALIRLQGYELMPSLQSEAVYNLSVPVLGANDTALGALTCPFLPRIDRSNVPDMMEALGILRGASRELSQVLGRGDEQAPD